MFRVHKIPQFMQNYFSGFEWSVETNEKKIFLTFDDGPIPEVTEFVLDTLEKYKAQATFFCVGDNVRKYPEIFKKIIEKKHSFGNHTFNHLKGWNTPLEKYLENINLCQEIFYKNINHTSEKPLNLFRPPYGRISNKQFNALKNDYRLIMWEVLSYDFDKSISPEICLKETLKNTRKGSIVVFHDSYKTEKNLRYALPKYLEIMTEKGFTFEKL